MSQYQTSPYQRIVNALNEWRAACGLSLLASELNAADAAEAAEKLVADWQRLDKACQDAYRQANHARAELAAARTDAANYSQRLAEIDAVLLRHDVQTLSPDESIAATIVRVLIDYGKERQRRKAAEDDAAAWQAERDANAAQLQYQTRRADALEQQLAALNSEFNNLVAAALANELHDENSALRSELAEARADRSRARARVESYSATLLDINNVLVRAKVVAPGEDPNIVDIVKALVAERDVARYDAASWEANAINNYQALQEAQANDAKWQARYEEVSDTLHRMVRAYLTSK